jgi:hypothetical protein
VSKRTRRTSVPPRGPALARRSFLLSFDVDCGELIPGHHLIARGLSDAGRLIAADRDGSAVDQMVAGFCLEYELVPGVPADRSDNFFGYVVQIDYRADVDLPWEPVDGGALAPFEGGPSTHGGRGDWPLPADARLLTFAMHRIVPGTTFPDATATGELRVDLSSGSAEWHPS